MDPAFFGPASITWEVNQEMTVLFGGARALLLHAAHPLVAAGARQTSMYSADPWARLIRTIRLQSTVTFGSRGEAEAAAEGINRLHYKVNGVDPVTGRRYDAVDPELLLWVHTCLELSSLMFFERTVRGLSPNERQRYHQESLVAAELMLLPRSHVPRTIEESENYFAEMVGSGVLMLTDVATDLAEIVRTGPVPRSVRWVWGLISRAAFGTLPVPVQRLYGIDWNRRRQTRLNLELSALRRIRPALPDRIRLIRPARWARDRLDGKTSISLDEEMKKVAQT